MDRHAQLAKARFDDWSDTYGEDRISPWFRFYQSLAMTKLKITEGWGFLDVGCGTGWAVREAAKQLRFGKACGIDISPKMIEKAVKQSPMDPNIEFRIGNSEAIPYPDDSFSSILCTCSFHHYPNPGRALAEMRRLTGGYQLPQDACNTFRVLYHQLEELEGDLHTHIHLENNILFPRAAKLETSLRA